MGTSPPLIKDHRPLWGWGNGVRSPRGWGRRPEGSWQRASKKIKLRSALVPKHQGRPHRRFCHLDSAPSSWTGPPPRWTTCQGESRNPGRGRTRTETETPGRGAIPSHTHGFGAVSLPRGGEGAICPLVPGVLFFFFFFYFFVPGVLNTQIQS